jgi:hypothetical protein
MHVRLRASILLESIPGHMKGCLKCIHKASMMLQKKEILLEEKGIKDLFPVFGVHTHENRGFNV